MRERMYSLFEKQGGKWVRITTLEMPKKQAVRSFQDALLAPVLNPGDPTVKGLRELRPVPGKCPDTHTHYED